MKDEVQSFEEGIVERMFRNFLDLMVLKLLREEPMWGYKIIKCVDEVYGVKLRHGALYPLLNNLEQKDFLRSHKNVEKGRVRKIYEITSRGIQLVDSYIEFLKGQLTENTKRR